MDIEKDEQPPKKESNEVNPIPYDSIHFIGWLKIISYIFRFVPTTSVQIASRYFV